MQYIALRKQLQDFVVFSIDDIRKIEPGFYRQRLHEWQKKGYLRKGVKGYYIFSDMSLNEPVLFIIANRIYSPSYVSFEMALSYYHFIPEMVYTVTSANSRNTYSFKAPIASFRYQKIKPAVLFGYRLVPYLKQRFLIAEPEKALLDYFYLHPSLQTEDDFEALRINVASFHEQIDLPKFHRYLQAMGNHALTQRMETFLRWIEHA